MCASLSQVLNMVIKNFFLIGGFVGVSTGIFEEFMKKKGNNVYTVLMSLEICFAFILAYCVLRNQIRASSIEVLAILFGNCVICGLIGNLISPVISAMITVLFLTVLLLVAIVQRADLRAQGLSIKNAFVAFCGKHQVELQPQEEPVCHKNTGDENMTKKEHNSITEVEEEPDRYRLREDIISFLIRVYTCQDSLSKRRKFFRKDTSSPMLYEDPLPIHISDEVQTIPVLIPALSSDNPAAQLEATTQLGKLLSGGYIPLIDKVKQEGVVPLLVQFLKRDNMPQLQSMAAWTLTNITAGLPEHTNIVIEHGAVPLLVKLLSSGSDDSKEQALWALGNIAGNSLTARDLVLKHGALSPLLSLMWNPSSTKKSTWSIAKWVFFNFTRRKPLRTLQDQILPALPGLGELLLMPDEEIILYACHLLSWFTQKSTNKMTQAIVEAKVCPRLVELLLHPDSKVVVPTLVILGDIASGDDAQSQVLINSGVLHCLKSLLTQSDKIILEYACSVIANITGGNNAQKQDVIDADLISSLVLLTKADFDIRKEAVWAIRNVTNGTRTHIRYLARNGCIEALCDQLTSTDETMLILCLTGLRNILNAGEINKEKGLSKRVNVYAQKIVECAGLDKIARLQSNDNNNIYEKALSLEILEKYFPEDIEENFPGNKQVSSSTVHVVPK